jgi:rhodanese-related sulfurtransferase
MQPHGYIPASPYGWAVLQEKLQTSNVREVSAARLKAGADDFVVLDLRDPDDFAKGHISGARSVLLFRPNTKKGPNLRNLLLMMTGSPLTEENPEFMEEVERIVPERKARIVLVCNLEEGSLDGNAKNPRGCISRSLLAAFRLVDEGYTDLRYLERGMPSWEAEGYPLVTDDACEQGSM